MPLGFASRNGLSGCTKRSAPIEEERRRARQPCRARAIHRCGSRHPTVLSWKISRAHRILRDLLNLFGLGNGRTREPLLLTSREVRQGHAFGRIYTRSPCSHARSTGNANIWSMWVLPVAIMSRRSRPTGRLPPPRGMRLPPGRPRKASSKGNRSNPLAEHAPADPRQSACVVRWNP